MPPPLSRGQFFGHTVRRRELGGLVLTDTRYAAGSRVPPHAHQHAYFCLVRRGHYTEVFDGRTRTCGPLTVAFHPPQERHSEHIDAEEAESFNVELGPAWWARVRDVAPALAGPAAFQGGALAALGLKLYREFRQMDAAAPLAIEGLVLEILAEAARQPVRAPVGIADGPPPWLARTRELLHTRFAEQPTLGEIAAEVGVHPVYLTSVFRRHYRCTMGEYLRRRRIAFACDRLAATDEPLAAIALAAGFADQSHFSRLFKQHTGLTPAAYRRQTRG